MRLLVLILAFLLPGCAPGQPTTSFKVGNAVYDVPDSHIRSLNEEPHQFVRIKGPERSFDLVYDSRTQGLDDPIRWPVLFSLNDAGAPNIERHASGRLKVVCRRAVNPRGGCGFRLSHRGADWAVLFPTAQLGQAHAISDQAEVALREYET